MRWIDCQPDVCQRVYFANHTSHLDTLLVHGVMPRAVRRRLFFGDDPLGVIQSVLKRPIPDPRLKNPDVPELIRASREVLEYPMIDRDPVPSWRDGRVVLLGDAAHPMYPIGSNGASQAILDARVLTACLAAEPEDLAAIPRRLRRQRRSSPVRRRLSSRSFCRDSGS